MGRGARALNGWHIGIIPDIHAPFEDKRAVKLTCKALKDWGVDWLVCVGDVCDMYSTSRFAKSAKLLGLTAKQELDATRRVLDQLDAIGAQRKIMCLGNHDVRLEKYVAERAPAVDGLVPTVDKYLELEARGWTCKAYGDFERIGDVLYTHDLDSAGADAHLRAKAEVNQGAAIGHTHRLAVAYDSPVVGRPRPGGMFGTLADRKKAMTYVKLAKLRHYQLAFGTAITLKSGATFMCPRPIIDYRCEIDGRVYSG